MRTSLLAPCAVLMTRPCARSYGSTAATFVGGRGSTLVDCKWCAWCGAVVGDAHCGMADVCFLGPSGWLAWLLVASMALRGDMSALSPAWAALLPQRLLPSTGRECWGELVCCRGRCPSAVRAPLTLAYVLVPLSSVFGCRAGLPTLLATLLGRPNGRGDYCSSVGCKWLRDCGAAVFAASLLAALTDARLNASVFCSDFVVCLLTFACFLSRLPAWAGPGGRYGCCPFTASECSETRCCSGRCISPSRSD